MNTWVFDGHPESIDKLREVSIPAAHRTLETILAAAANASSAQPTRLEGWTLGHLVAHLRLNAESHIRVLDAARAGRLVDQYPGGAQGRAAAIERDHTASFADQVSRLRSVQSELEAIWAAMSHDDWHQPARTRSGVRPSHVLLWARWREAYVHTVDLDLGYTSDEWPEEFSTAGIGINVGGFELRPLSDRLPPGTVVQLGDGTNTWSSHTDRPATHTARGSSQALLGWIVQRPAIHRPRWDAEPSLDRWP